jgi:hypothetical protein
MVQSLYTNIVNPGLRRYSVDVLLDHSTSFESQLVKTDILLLYVEILTGWIDMRYIWPIVSSKFYSLSEVWRFYNLKRQEKNLMWLKNNKSLVIFRREFQISILLLLT